MQQPGTDKYYVCLGLIVQLLVALWKVKPMMLKDGSTCFVVGSGDELYSNLLPTFIHPIELDDFEERALHYFDRLISAVEEDIPALENQQIGLNSPISQQGRYHELLEANVAEFAFWYSGMMLAA